MPSLDIAHRRLHNQHIAGTPLATPAAVVRWLGAVQAQDYGAAKWAVAQRAQGVTDAALDQAVAEGAILRTHVLRPTWHFVTPEDIHWLLALTAPRVKAAMAYYDRRLELDDHLVGRSDAALATALTGGRQLTRPELAAVLTRAGVTATLRYSAFLDLPVQVRVAGGPASTAATRASSVCSCTGLVR